MRAIVVRQAGGTENMHLEEVPDPDMRENEVMIEVEACGVCFHDVVTRNGVMRRGVEIPFPRSTVYVKSDAGAAAEDLSAEDAAAAGA